MATSASRSGRDGRHHDHAGAVRLLQRFVATSAKPRSSVAADAPIGQIQLAALHHPDPSCAVVAWASSITTPTRRRHRFSPWLCAIPSSSSATPRCTPSRARPAGPRSCAWRTWCRTWSRSCSRTPARSCATRPFRCCFASPTVTLGPDKSSSRPPTTTGMSWYERSHAARSPVSTYAAAGRTSAEQGARAHQPDATTPADLPQIAGSGVDVPVYP